MTDGFLSFATLFLHSYGLQLETIDGRFVVSFFPRCSFFLSLPLEQATELQESEQPLPILFIPPSRSARQTTSTTIRTSPSTLSSSRFASVLRTPIYSTQTRLTNPLLHHVQPLHYTRRREVQAPLALAPSFIEGSAHETVEAQHLSFVRT